MSKLLSPIPAIYPVYDKRVRCENWIGIGFSLGEVSMGVKMCQKVGTVVSAPAPHAEGRGFESALRNHFDENLFELICC